MSTLSPVGRYGGGRGWRRARTAIVLLIGVGALVGAGWEGRSLWQQNDSTSTATASTSASVSSSPSCSPTIAIVTSASPASSKSKAHSSKSASTATSSKLPKPKTITLNVYNATTRNGLARKTATQLSSRGFTIGVVSNDPTGKSVKGAAEVRYGPKGALAARVVAAEVVGAKLVPVKRTSTDVDIALGAAYKHLATSAQVKAALTVKSSPSPTPSC